jgi:hypothetical protein
MECVIVIIRNRWHRVVDSSRRELGGTEKEETLGSQAAQTQNTCVSGLDQV